jgi:cytochrome c oxidase assembly protein subunit 15
LPGSLPLFIGGNALSSSLQVSEGHRRTLNWFTRLTSLCTLFLIFAGGLVKSHEAGLAVPDWPLSYGMLMPPMVGNIFWEHGHRMVATLVGFLTLVQAFWIWQIEPRSWVRKLGFLALVMVISQGLLGGLTVIYLLPTPISVSHACLAQAFFCVTIVLAMITSPSWSTTGEEPRVPGKLWRLTLGVSLMIYIQLILGALMRHTGAGLAIPDFPLHLGQIVPSFATEGVLIHFAHRIWGYLVAVSVFLVGASLLANPGVSRSLRALAGLTLVDVVAQITLGALTVLWEKPPFLTSFHVVNGALLLGLFILLSLQLYRLRE